MSLHQRVRLAMLALAVSVLGILGGAGVANAAPKGPVAVFNSDSPAGIAVNQTSGDVYVVDVNGERVQRFAADGTFISSIGEAGTAAGQFAFGGTPAGVAVGLDASLYVADTGNNRVQQFTADGTFVRMWGFGVQTGAQVFETCTSICQPGVIPPSESPSDSGDGQLWSPRGVAVDPVDGDVLVADYQNSRVQRFSSTGVYESQFNGDGQFSSPVRLAVDSTGAIYVASDPDQGMAVKKFDASGAFVASLDEVASPTDVAVDAATDDVFLVQPAEGGTEVVELAADGALIDRHLTPAAYPVLGLAVHSTTERIYVSDNGSNRVFVLDDPVQSATIEQPTDDDVESRTAVLRGTVNPGGGLPVGYHFEVSADGGQTWTSFPEPDVQLDPGTADVPVTETATGLEPGRDYLARLVVRNEYGSTATSAETTFTTDPEPPDVTTLDATQLSASGALLNGEINPNNAETTYHFEYGETTAYGTSVPIPEASVGATGATVAVFQRIEGLEPGTSYHYRLVARNEAGLSFGGDRSFSTRAAAIPPPGRGYELVSPAHKVGGVGVGHWFGGPDAVGYVGMPAHDGERFAVRGQNGSTVADGAFAYVNDWAFADRTPEGWVHRPGVSRRAHAPQPTTDITLSSASPDLSLTGWTSAAILALFPEMAQWDATEMSTALMLRKWIEPQWELFGPTEPSQDVFGSGEIATGPRSVAADGSAVIASGPGTRGLAGERDPSVDLPDLEEPGAAGDPSSIYLDEIEGPFSDAFPGDNGERELVNVCSGTEAGGDRTLLPTGPCAEAADKDTLTSPGGASLTAGNSGGNPPASVISADGSRVFFMSPDANLSGFGPPQLFVRQRMVGGEVVVRWISQSEVDGNASLLGPTLFEGASRDGDKVFFRTTSPLTADDPNGGLTDQPSVESWDLYMYDLPDGPDGKRATPDGDPAGGDLTRISAGPGGDADCNVQAGTLRWLSNAGSRAYFTCAAPLASVAGASNGTITTPGGTTASSDASNLYLHESADLERSWRFVARLPRDTTLGACATRPNGRGSTIAAKPGGTGSDFSIDDNNNCVRGASDGSLVTFFTDGRLTGDDPDSVSGDIYGYDLDRDELTRLSAPQGGAGGTYPCLPGNEDSVPCHGDGGIGAGPMALEALGVAVRPDKVRPDGTVVEGDRLAFFESRRPLVPEDDDESYDVYQWRNGDLTLLSTGVYDADGAFYVGNDRSGLNVYLATRAQLTWQDSDRQLDVYTARLRGGIPQPQPEPPCPALADGCRAAGGPLTRPGIDRAPGPGDAAPKRRKTLALGRLTRAQLRRAARTGRIRLRVRTSSPGVLRVSARAKVGARTRVVGRASKQVAKPGLVTVTLRLSGRARAVLRRGRPLRVTLRVRQAGARSRSATVRLRRGRR